jgi:SPP1 gp7 family putative phage head morphogenesis protein
MRTQELFDRQVEHLISTRRYSESVKLLLTRASTRHQSTLRKLLTLNINSKLDQEVARYVNELFDIGERGVKDFVGAELSFQTKNLSKATSPFYAVTSPSLREVEREILSSPLRIHEEGNKSVSPSLRKSMESIGQTELTKINARIRKELVAGTSEADIIKKVIRTAKISEQQAKTLVVTNMTQAQQIITNKVVSANSDVISGFIFTAILDSRTSKLCSHYDDLFQSADNVRVRPPLHWNCRSTLVPVLKSKAAILRSKNKNLNIDKLIELDDAELPGATPIKETIDVWLRRQAFSKQVEFLGSEEKVTLFQQGTLAVADFFSTLGKPISLSALRVKDNLLTYFSPTRAVAEDPAKVLLTVSRPFQLVRSAALQKNLRDFYILEAGNAGSPLSLVDYRGVTIAGKKSVRHRANNVFDERNVSFDPFTGEVRSTLYYDPDFISYRERMDYMRNSKILDRNQKEFIENFVEGFDDRLSINQRSAVIENLRVLFERYENKKVPWENFSAVLRSELPYSVINTSRILDRKSREGAELFLSWKGDPDTPSVFVQGQRITLEELHNNKIIYENYVDKWRKLEGVRFARELYWRGKAPFRTYFYDWITESFPKKPKTLQEKLLDSFTKTQIRKVFFRDDPVAYFLRYGKAPKAMKKIIKDHIKDKIKDSIPYYKFLEKVYKEGAYNFVVRTLRENYRYIADLQIARDKLFFNIINNLFESVLHDKEPVRVLSRVVTIIAEGRTTDYDSLAITIGRTLKEEWPEIFPLLGSTVQDYHTQGSRILAHFEKAGILRVNSRGVLRRSIIDLDTLRPGGDWKDTVSREVQILDPTMLKLQDYNRRLELSNRIGVTSPTNKYYVVPGKKTYLDARGKDTGIPIVTRSAFANFDEKQIDSDFANMLNHTMSVEYEVDEEFSGFMDRLVKFKDDRGRAEYYDSINSFREEIIRRGDQGYGLMEVLRYYRKTKKPFTVHARIDSRGRVYYNGYLTPTGGEVIRPFLNSAKATSMTPAGVQQIQIQLASVIGPGTEALTTAGRLAIFKRHEKDILRVGKLMSEKTQLDRRIREFLDDPFIQSIEPEEVAKVARFALEYYRIHTHMDGNLDFSGFNKTIFGESYVNYLATQARVEKFSPQVVYHEFWDDPKTIAWAKEKGYTLKPFDLTEKEKLRIKARDGIEEMHRARERFMLSIVKQADPDVRNAFIVGNDHVFDKGSVLANSVYRKVHMNGQIFEDKNLAKLSAYKTKLMGEADASASGLQVIALSTGNRGAALTSNVLQTRSKQRIYDLVAQDVVADPRFQELMDELGLNLTWEDLSKAAKYQVMIAL